ncbi:MAG: hypothetical protein V3573_12210 [Desulfovibrionaceae bacterium]
MRCLLLVLAMLAFPVVAMAGDVRPGTPEFAAKQAYEGGHSLNFEMMAASACMSEADRQELKAFFDAQIEELRQGGIDLALVRYDFSGLNYTLLEQDRELARVEITGPYIISGPMGTNRDQDPDVLILEKIDGRWLMCGDQDRARMPLAEYRAGLGAPEASDTVEAGEEVAVSGPSPVEATRMFCESVYRIDGPVMEKFMCAEMREAGVAEMAGEARSEFEASGVRWSEVKHDFTNLRYQELRREGDQAEVRLTGRYAFTHPQLGDNEQEEDQVFRLVVEDGRWVVCDE